MAGSRLGGSVGTDELNEWAGEEEAGSFVAVGAAVAARGEKERKS